MRKIPNKYTITYKGDYTGSITADYGSDVTLPAAPTGYIYRFESGGRTWTGKNITGNVTVYVTKIADCVDILGINLDNWKLEGDSLTGDYLYLKWTHKIDLFDGATYELCQAGYSEPLAPLVMLDECTDFNIKVTAPSGRTKTYSLKINISTPKTLGSFTVSQITGGSITAKLKTPIPGKPQVYLEYGVSREVFNDRVEAVLSEDGSMLYASGLPENKELYCRVFADYDGIYTNSEAVLIKTGITLSSDCYVLATLSPLGGKIIHNGEREDGEISDLRVANSFDSISIDVEVSRGAEWGLYYSKTSKIPIADRTVKLSEGRASTRYIKVKSEDGIHEKTYKITIYRQSKSAVPTVSASRGIVTMTMEADGKIYYTTDKSDPSEINGSVYTKPFAVEPGTVIKAAAKADDKDELSDIVIYTVEDDATVTVSKVSVEKKGGKYEYEFYVESPNAFNGIFVVAGYSSDGRLTEITRTALNENVSEYLVSDSIKINSETSYYKYFLWDEANFISLCEAQEIIFDN